MQPCDHHMSLSIKTHNSNTNNTPDISIIKHSSFKSNFEPEVGQMDLQGRCVFERVTRHMKSNSVAVMAG